MVSYVHIFVLLCLFYDHNIFFFISVDFSRRLLRAPPNFIDFPLGTAGAAGAPGDRGTLAVLGFEGKEGEEGEEGERGVAEAGAAGAAVAAGDFGELALVGAAGFPGAAGAAGCPLGIRFPIIVLLYFNNYENIYKRSKKILTIKHICCIHLFTI